MSQLIQETETEFDEPTFRPYKAFAETGDCADVDFPTSTDVSKQTYADNVGFMFVGRLIVKHAP